MNSIIRRHILNVFFSIHKFKGLRVSENSYHQKFDKTFPLTKNWDVNFNMININIYNININKIFRLQYLY